MTELSHTINEGRLALSLTQERKARGLSLAIGPIHFDPNLHPRDLKGKFKSAIGGLADGQSLEMPDGTRVTKHAQGFDVTPKSGSSRNARNAEEAAHDALTQSAKTRHPQSVGGASSFKNLDNALSKHERDHHTSTADLEREHSSASAPITGTQNPMDRSKKLSPEAQAAGRMDRSAAGGGPAKPPGADQSTAAGTDDVAKAVKDTLPDGWEYNGDDGSGFHEVLDPDGYAYSVGKEGDKWEVTQLDMEGDPIQVWDGGSAEAALKALNDNPPTMNAEAGAHNHGDGKPAQGESDPQLKWEDDVRKEIERRGFNPDDVETSVEGFGQDYAEYADDPKAYVDTALDEHAMMTDEAGAASGGNETETVNKLAKALSDPNGNGLQVSSYDNGNGTRSFTLEDPNGEDEFWYEVAPDTDTGGWQISTWRAWDPNGDPTAPDPNWEPEDAEDYTTAPTLDEAIKKMGVTLDTTPDGPTPSTVSSHNDKGHFRSRSIGELDAGTPQENTTEGHVATVLSAIDAQITQDDPEWDQSITDLYDAVRHGGELNQGEQDLLAHILQDDMDASEENMKEGGADESDHIKKLDTVYNLVTRGKGGHKGGK